MDALTAWIDRAWYPSFHDHWDDWLFRERVLSQLRPDSVVLDLGAGAGVLPQMDFRGKAARVCGIDLDPRVSANPTLDEGRVADAEKIPYNAGDFDLVFANNVLEHLAEPLTVFREVARVLKPGGMLLFKTPNKRHYIPLLARLTPHRFHRFVNRLRGRAEVDTFPTLYRANTRSDVIRLAGQSGMSVERIECIEGRPEYLRLMWPTYVVGAAYERLVNLHEGFAPFRILIVGNLRKRAARP